MIVQDWDNEFEEIINIQKNPELQKKDRYDKYSYLQLKELIKEYKLKYQELVDIPDTILNCKYLSIEISMIDRKIEYIERKKTTSL